MSRSVSSFLGAPGVVLISALVVGLVVGFWMLESADPDLYYRSVQEDEALEWASFWAFVLAGLAFAAAAWRARSAGALACLWFAGLALFCLGVAGEEISWGQRVFGFRPPDYFLEHNFQQELNVHNVMDKGLRKLAVRGLVLGLFVALPLLAAWPALARGLARVGVTAPPRGLVPLGLGSFLLYDAYPLRFTGEIVEALLGLLFLAAAVAVALPAGRPWRAAAGLAAAVFLTAGLGAASAELSRRGGAADPTRVAAARIELAALRRDFVGEGAARPIRTGCGLHRRLYTLTQRNKAGALLRGHFASLAERGLPPSRVGFLLDPWNGPYWVRDECDDERRQIFVYSFGPNRARDSTEWEIGGDDVGVVIRREGF